jgi:hypothetical protein
MSELNRTINRSTTCEDHLKHWIVEGRILQPLWASTRPFFVAQGFESAVEGYIRDKVRKESQGVQREMQTSNGR